MNTISIINKSPDADNSYKNRSLAVFGKTCVLLDGEVTVEYNGKSVSFGPGDDVILPEGLFSVWKVTKPVRMRGAV